MGLGFLGFRVSGVGVYGLWFGVSCAADSADFDPQFLESLASHGVPSGQSPNHGKDKLGHRRIDLAHCRQAETYG